jgi:hypothetical protein
VVIGIDPYKATRTVVVIDRDVDVRGTHPATVRRPRRLWADTTEAAVSANAHGYRRGTRTEVPGSERLPEIPLAGDQGR